jgi:hypothetical protein
MRFSVRLSALHIEALPDATVEDFPSPELSMATNATVAILTLVERLLQLRALNVCVYLDQKPAH